MILNTFKDISYGFPGHHQNAPHINSFLSRGHCDVIQVRVLWESEQRNSIGGGHPWRVASHSFSFSFIYRPILDKGVLYTAKILDRKDLNRQLVKSQTCTVLIPEYELTIPAHRGQLTTVEGLIRDTIKDLAVGQPLRKIDDEPAYNKIQRMLDAFRGIIGDDDSDGEGIGEAESKLEHNISPFTIQLDDPAGDSFIEFYESMSDPKWNVRQYTRSKDQNIALGLAQVDEDAASDLLKAAKQSHKAPMALVDEIEAEEIFVFPGVCSSCGHPLDTLMKKIVIPYFKVFWDSFSVTSLLTSAH